MAVKHYRVIAPNGERVRLDFKGKIFSFIHGEIVKIEEDLAKSFKSIFYEVKVEPPKEQPESPDINKDSKPQQKEKKNEKKDEKKETKKETKPAGQKATKTTQKK